MVVSSEKIYFAFLRLIQIFKCVQELLFTTGLVYFHSLDLVAKSGWLSYEIILIIAVFVCIFMYNDAGLSDVHLQSESLILRVTDQIFNEVYVLL